jgi:NhaP-type Na+/H+ or K+/H+ antiporter
MRERLFVALAWLPKATVQAAVGPVALDLARGRSDPATVAMATTVLTIAVLSILITAPLGALLIAVTGPKLLRFQERAEHEYEDSVTQGPNSRHNSAVNSGVHSINSVTPSPDKRVNFEA